MTDPHKDYWLETVSIAAEDCGLTLTAEQLNFMADAMQGSHENYGQAFYSPPPSDRYAEIDRGWQKRFNDLQAEFDRYRGNAETAVKKALRQYSDANVSIGEGGEVLRHGGRTTVIQ